MAVVAVQHIRRMRGGAQGQLMLGADGHVYVVKFQNNPQHMRVLANELLASRLAVAAGLTAPEAELVDVSSWLVENTPELEMDLGRTRARCHAGAAVRVAVCGRADAGTGGGLSAGGAVGRGEESRRSLRGSWRWTSGRGTPMGGRRCSRASSGSGGIRRCSSTYGYCFHAGDWRFEDAPLRGVYYRNDVYREITGWDVV